MKLILIVPLGSNAAIDMRCSAWCSALAANGEVEMRYTMGIDCDEGRNNLIAQALADREMTHVFLLDSDTVPPWDAVRRLMDLHMPICCGLTPILLHGKDFAWNVRTPDGRGWWPAQRPLPAEPFVTRHVGGTTILAERCVLESIGYPWFHRTSGNITRGEGPVVQSGDVFFSERVNAAGWQIWAHPGVQCDHWKLFNLRSLMPGAKALTGPEEPFAGAAAIQPEATVDVEFPGLVQEMELRARFEREQRERLGAPVEAPLGAPVEAPLPDRKEVLV